MTAKNFSFIFLITAFLLSLSVKILKKVVIYTTKNNIRSQMMVKMQGPYSERYDGMQLKIESKRLKSGKCQVKFYAKGSDAEDLYGYALVDGNKPLTEVVKEIKTKLHNVGSINGFYHQHLFSIKRNTTPVEDFVIFRG